MGGINLKAGDTMPDLGTVTVTEERIGSVHKVKFDWTSEVGGGATKTTVQAYSGEIIRLLTIPGTAGDAPTNLYDVVVNDEDATDTLMGAGANRAAASTEQVLKASLGCMANDTLSLAVTNAGDSNKGTVILYIR